MLQVTVSRVVGLAAGPQGMPAWFGESERRRWPQLGSGARDAFVASRALLRDLLQASTGVPAAAWDVSAEAGQAPVATSAASVADVRVSLSQRLGWVAAAVSDAAVGVDVEVARPPRSDPVERAALMLDPAQLAAWNGLPVDEREPALLTAWTAKEAWFKACPAGAAPWDFRRVAAHACAPARANVRVWAAPPLHVAVCCADAGDLARVECTGVGAATSTSTYWHVGRA